MDFLLKVGQAKYIEDMYNNEYLYFNTFKKFKTSEKDSSGRNDSREANTLNRQANNLEVTIPTGKTIKFDEIFTNFNAQYNESPTELPFNICSLYKLNLNDKFIYKEIDERILWLGDKTLIIYNIGQFFKTLDEELDRQGLKYSRRPVKYYNPKKLDGELTFHDKDEFYDYQKEYRVLVRTSGLKAFNVRLNGLKKISAVVNTDQLNTLEVKSV